MRLTTAVDDEPGAMLTVALLAPGKRASVAVCTAAVSVAVSDRANVTWVVTAVGVVVVGAPAVTATDDDTGDRLGVLANQLPSAVDEPPAGGDAAAALIADEAAAAATAP